MLHAHFTCICYMHILHAHVTCTFYMHILHAHYIEVVWKVGRYTSAAPFYFTEIDNYIDGGMLANDPSEVALTAIQDFYHNRGEKIPISLLVSVGSGVNPALPLGKIDIKSNLLNPKAYLDLMEVLESSVSEVDLVELRFLPVVYFTYQY